MAVFNSIVLVESLTLKCMVVCFQQCKKISEHLFWKSLAEGMIHLKFLKALFRFCKFISKAGYEIQL